MTTSHTFENLPELATQLRERLETKRYVLLFAFNGTGKTRLSMAFKEQGKQGDGEDETRDTLYFNAFTEDLFYWDNDLENDAKRVLRLNRDSHFFDGLQELEMENRIGPLLGRYADFDFVIVYESWDITFFRANETDGGRFHITVWHGGENVLVWWCFMSVA